jgi:hypothetical protein
MSQPLIIAGMHRSGTSLMSNALQAAGVNLGVEMLAANVANPRGYFEDVDFYGFHERLLHVRHQSYLYLSDDFEFHPSEEEVVSAQRLIAERSHLSLWGWKDPRTSLFLPFWKRLLPQGKFVFLFRHPLLVMSSLLRRGEFDCHPALVQGLNAWGRYNAAIKAFHEEHPDSSVLVHIEGVLRRPDDFGRLLREKLGLDVAFDRETLTGVYHAGELEELEPPCEAVQVLRALQPELVELYGQLNLTADIPAPWDLNEASAPAQLTRLAAFVKRAPTPLSLAERHSFMHLLMASLALEATESMMQRFTSHVQTAQQRSDYVWQQLQQAESLLREHQRELKSLDLKLASIASPAESSASPLRRRGRVRNLVAAIWPGRDSQGCDRDSGLDRSAA